MAKVSLRDVVIRGCSKPKCSTGSSSLNRHHRRHQAMWLGIWQVRRRSEARWRAFVRRYEEYLDEDCCLICVAHHAEIHFIYDRVIKQDVKMRGKSLRNYTWGEAEKLMDKLESVCEKWLGSETPGMDPRTLERFRARKNRK